MTDIERRMAAKQFAADWNTVLLAGVAAKSLWHTRTGKIY